ncbi:MAG: phosphate ABC transporter permease PstA [Clostridia bacterium]
MLKRKSHKIDSSIGNAYSFLSLAIIVCVCLFIILTTIYFGRQAISLHFLSTEPNPSALDAASGGILTPMIGTILLTLIGIMIAVPFALATAIYLRFYSKKGIFLSLVKSAVNILSGIPTVVVALFALVIFTQPMFAFLSAKIEGVEGSNMAYGKSFLVAGVTMAIMILPFVIKSMEEVLKTVPESYIHGSLALGATKWQTISKVVLPSARSGIATGIILGMGRIVGDTAIVWLTLGGTLRMTGNQPWYLPGNFWSTLVNTGSTLTTYIYYTSPAGEGNSLEVAFGAAIVLIAIIILLNLAATFIAGIGELKHE